MHLVGTGFLPLEEAAHAIPFAALVGLLRVIAGAVEEPVAVLLAVVFEGLGDVHVALQRRCDQIGLALGIGAAAEGTHKATFDAEGFIRDCLAHVQAQGLAKAPAGGAGADRIVEAEQTRRGRGQVDIAMGAMPARGVVQDAGVRRSALRHH